MTRSLLLTIRLIPFALIAVAATTAAAETGPTVQVVKPTRVDVAKRVSFPATLAPWQEVTIQPRIGGQILEILADIGDRVTTGQVLVRLDNPELEAEHLAAKADIAQASATLAQARAEEIVAKAELQSSQLALSLGSRQTERLQGLQRSQSATAKEIEEAQKYQITAQSGIEEARARIAMAAAQMEVADARRLTALARLEKARVMLSFLEVCAPFAGVVVSRMIDPGAMVTASGTPLFRVQDDSRLRAVIDLSEVDAVFATPGKPVEISSVALGGAAYEAVISRTAVSLSPGTKTLRVEADIDNADRRLFAGMYTQAVVQLDVHEDALTLPANAVRTKGGKSNVLVVADGKIRQVIVKTGYDNAIRTEITDGLTGNEDVVVSTREGLSDGAAVKVQSEQDEAKPLAQAAASH